MSLEDKVVWSEGMLLRPQHLQQHDRFIDRQLRVRSQLLDPLGWGINFLKIDDQLLQQGAFALVQCEGILPDGTLFHCDSGSDRLLLEVHPGMQQQLVYLALPVLLKGADETALQSNDSCLTRWQGWNQDIQDSNLGSTKAVNIGVAKPRFSLFLESDLSPDYCHIPIARIKESFIDGRIELDEHYIPPCLSVSASQRLAFYLKETVSLLSHRGQAIASRLSGASGKRGTADISDFMLLQLVNRYQSQFKHFMQLGQVHPEALYQALAMLNGEVATFTQEAKLAQPVIPYQHKQLTECFGQLMGEIRQALSLVFEQTALALPIQERRFGVRVAPIQDRALLDQAQFYLAVKSQWSQDSIGSRLPGVIKAGGVEQLRELVNLQLPGISLVPLPVAPRQIPYTAGCSYFQLEKSPEHWAQLKKSGGIAFHFSGEVPGLELELWAVKG
jgi:type VI secretion system protein ImpJ